MPLKLLEARYAHLNVIQSEIRLHTTQSQYPNQPPLIAGVHMTGYLKSQSDTTLLKFPRNRSDKIPLHTLLTAAGVDLDQEGIYRKC